MSSLLGAHEYRARGQTYCVTVTRLCHMYLVQCAKSRVGAVLSLKGADGLPARVPLSDTSYSHTLNRRPRARSMRENAKVSAAILPVQLGHTVMLPKRC